MESHLEQHVAELLFKVLVAVGSFQSVDRFHQLVGFLYEVAPETGMGLSTIPRAALAKHPDELHEAGQFPRYR